jgi:hypothetical protein
MINEFSSISEKLNKHELYNLYHSYGYFNDDRMMMLPGLPHLLNSYPMQLSMMAHSGHFNDICIMPRQSMDHEQNNAKKAVGVVKSQLKSKLYYGTDNHHSPDNQLINHLPNIIIISIIIITITMIVITTEKWNPLEDRILKTVVCRYGTANCKTNHSHVTPHE